MEVEVMQPAMELVNLYKSIGKKQIIKNLSFSIYPGEVFGFLGPNGAGKTTTIRMMVGLMKITSGDVKINGTSVKNDFKGAIQHVGAIVENPEMYPFMNGWKNLKHYARMMNGITDERIREVVSLVGLEKAMKEKVGKYSLGMRQRMGIAQALLHRPSVLILDEPTNGLDPAGIREIRQYIRRLAEQEQVAVIVSSHLLSEIELMCDRISIIKNGELVTVEEVQNSTEKDERVEVWLEVEPVDKAKAVIEKHHELEVVVHHDKLSMSVTKETIPEIVKGLVQDQVNVYEVTTKSSSLEDKFFDVIGENTIA
ncbi:ABC-type transport system ATP-binding protein [Gracilibacillus halophilus YIM-C55.5]|uniref:ABC-type transport system ATP-binding protein n=1 Tax=Gracilibacillus halophilus YIM-C55.5 TaxID=1308866 RepID=N4WJY2_9BACI|nr:ABC transporter ATP-binding protein [Gracilibacillus halophilus]ENH96477.1 ABC-type transport system ATP-binding protein [Gracilibacillus halophilus YIM-C55.5]